jgi:hypothetical protein
MVWLPLYIEQDVHIFEVLAVDKTLAHDQVLNFVKETTQKKDNGGKQCNQDVEYGTG